MKKDLGESVANWLNAPAHLTGAERQFFPREPLGDQEICANVQRFFVLRCWMLNRSAKRRLRHAISRANRAVGGADRNDDSKNGANGRTGDARFPNVLPPGSTDSSQNFRQNACRAEEGTETRRQMQFENRIAGANVAMAILTGALVSVGIASAVIANRTVDVIKAQLAEMKACSDQNEKLILSNADLAAAAKSQAAAEEKSVMTAQEALLMSQRARITSVGAALDNLQIGQGVTATLNYANVGHEAAPVDTVFILREWSKTDWETNAVTQPSNFRNDCVAINHVGGANIAFPASGPGIGYSDTISSDDSVSGGSHKFKIDENVLNGNAVIAVNACYVYSTFKEFHHTVSCYFHLAHKTPSVSNLNICGTGSYAD